MYSKSLRATVFKVITDRYLKNIHQQQILLIHATVPGLPDGRKPESQFRYIMGLGMENVGIFYEQLEQFTAIWYTLFASGIHILWSFGIFSPLW
jgi:hypothetical protein